MASMRANSASSAAPIAPAQGSEAAATPPRTLDAPVGVDAYRADYEAAPTDATTKP